MGRAGILPWLVLGGAAAAQGLDAPRRIEEYERFRERALPVPSQQPPPEPTPSIPNPHEPPTGRHYRLVHVDTPPEIDGNLSEPIWQGAPDAGGFLSDLSEPRGQPTTAPTEFQAAYDDDNLYIAIRARDAPGAEPDRTVPANEQDVWALEGVIISVDARHDHNHYLAFIMTRGGYRADLEIGGTHDPPDAWRLNYEWRGEWYGAVQETEGGWTAEIQIPWSTVGLPSHDEAFAIGANVGRWVNTPAEDNDWSLTPAGYDWPKPTHFGHFEFPTGVQPGQRVYLAPFVTGLYEQDAATLSRLRNMPGIDAPATAYGGFYGRVRPVGPLQLDLAANPDFLGAPPDPALSPLDRFQLYYPEQRDFFLQEKSRYDFGTPSSLLFYSRRIGLTPSAVGFVETPLLYGAKADVAAGDSELGALDVSTAASPGIRLGQNFAVARGQHFFDNGSRLGAIFLNTSDPSQASTYRAYGVDGQVAFYDEHMRLSGFGARTDTAGAPSGYAGNLNLNWTSDQFIARGSYLYVGDTFDPQLGYYPLTGIRQAEAEAAYLPRVYTDLVRRLKIDAVISRTGGLDGSLLIDRQTGSVLGQFSNQGDFGVNVVHSVDGVVTPFTLAGGRLNIPQGSYDSLYAEVFLDSAPGRYGFQLDYLEGSFFGGYRRMPSAQFRLRLTRFNGAVRWQYFDLNVGGTHASGQRVSAQAVFAFTPDIKSTFYLELNTLDPAAVAELVFSYQFGRVSSVLLVLTQRAPSAGAFSSTNYLQAALKFTYGFAFL